MSAETPENASATPAEAEKAPTAVADKPAAAKPEAPPEPPFNVDVLLSCTARFTHKAWYLFYNNQKDMDFIRKAPVRATLEARTAAGAEELHRLLAEAGVTELSRLDKTLSFTATFETIQLVLKHPQAYLLDAVKI